MQAQRIKSVKSLGKKKCLDFTVDSRDHNFYAEGIVVSNCYAYSYITAYTTYLKANHTFEYFMSCLKMAQFEDQPLECIDGIQSELPFFNIQLLPPDILKSTEDYSLEGRNIRMGINAIKGLAGAALPKVKSFKAAVNNKFDLFVNLQSAKIPVNVAASLILSGCFDSIRGEVSRNKLLLEFELWKELTDKELINCYAFGSKYNYDLMTIVKEMSSNLHNEKGKPYIKDSRLTTLKKDYDPAKQKYLRNSAFEELCAYIMETEYLGFSYSYTLKNIYSKWVKDLSTISEVNNTDSNQKVRFVAIIKELKKKVSKKKVPYIALELRDERASIKAMIFKEDRIEASKEFNKKDLEEDDIIIVNGLKKDDVVFIDSVSIQDNPIIIKKSDLKNEKEIK